MNDLEQDLISIAKIVSEAVKAPGTPLQDSLDALKTLTSLYAALQKNKGKSGEEEPDAVSFDHFSAALEEHADGAAAPVRGDRGKRRAITEVQ